MIYAEKTALNKTSDYVIRTLATPVTVAADVVVVAVAVFVFVHADKDSLDAYNREVQDREMNAMTSTLNQSHFEPADK